MPDTDVRPSFSKLGLVVVVLTGIAAAVAIPVTDHFRVEAHSVKFGEIDRHDEFQDRRLDAMDEHLSEIKVLKETNRWILDALDRAERRAGYTPPPRPPAAP